MSTWCDRKQREETCWGEVRCVATRMDEEGFEEKTHACEGHALPEYKPMDAKRAAIQRLMDATRESESMLCGQSEGRFPEQDRVLAHHRDLTEARDEVYLLLGIITEKGKPLADPLESEF